VERYCLLDAHHDGVGKTTQKHDQCENDIHDADLLVVHTGEPFVPQIPPKPEIGNQPHNRDTPNCDHYEGHQEDWFVIGYRFQGEAPEDHTRGTVTANHDRTFPKLLLSDCRFFNLLVL